MKTADKEYLRHEEGKLYNSHAWLLLACYYAFWIPTKSYLWWARDKKFNTLGVVLIASTIITAIAFIIEIRKGFW